MANQKQQFLDAIPKHQVGGSLKMLLLIQIVLESDEDGMAIISHDEFAEKCHMSKRSVISHLKYLSEMGFIKTVKRCNTHGQSLPNSYFLNFEKMGVRAND